MRCHLVPLVVFSGLLVSSVAAQPRTWIVDAGGGGDFADIPPALAVARAGDTVLVRPGTYTPGSTSEGIRLVGTDAVLRPTPAFRVTDLPAGQTFVMRGFSSDLPSLSNFGIELVDNQGLILLQDLQANPPLFFASSIVHALVVQRSTSVQLANCALLGAVAASSSRVVATDCELRGIPWNLPVGPSPAVAMTASDVTLVQCRVQGGNGFSQIGPTPQSGVRMIGGGLEICGSQTVVRGGRDERPFGGGIWPGVWSDGGIVRIDRRAAGGISVVGSSTVSVVPLACITAASVPPNGTLMPQFEIDAGRLTMIAASLPGSAQPTVFGELWLDAGTTVGLFLGTWPPPAPIRVTLNRNFAPGTGVTFQGAVLFPRGLELTPPATATVR